MAEIIAGVVFIIIGIGCLIVLGLSVVVEADANAFNADAGMGRAMLLSLVGAVASFALAAALFLS